MSLEEAHFALLGKLSGHKTGDLLLFNCPSWDDEGRRKIECKTADLSMCKKSLYFHLLQMGSELERNCIQQHVANPVSSVRTSIVDEESLT